jgi:hypothetical protein
MSIELTDLEKAYIEISDFHDPVGKTYGPIETWTSERLDCVIYELARVSESHYLGVAEDEINEDASDRAFDGELLSDEEAESIRERWRNYFASSQTILQKVKALLGERKQALIATMPAAEREALLQFAPHGSDPYDPASDRLWSEGVEPLTSPEGEVHLALCALQAKGLIEGTYNDPLERLEWELRKSKAQEVMIPLLYQGGTP